MKKYFFITTLFGALMLSTIVLFASSSARDRVEALRARYRTSFTSWAASPLPELSAEVVRRAAELIRAYDTLIKESASDPEYTTHDVANAEQDIRALQSLSDQVQLAAVEQYVRGLRYLMEDVRTIVAISGDSEHAAAAERMVDELNAQLTQLRERYTTEGRLTSTLIRDLRALVGNATRAYDAIMEIRGMKELKSDIRAPSDITEAPRQTGSGAVAGVREIWEQREEYDRYRTIRARYFPDEPGRRGATIQLLPPLPESPSFFPLRDAVMNAPALTRFPPAVAYLVVTKPNLYAEHQRMWSAYVDRLSRTETMKALNDILEEFGQYRQSAVQDAEGKE